MSHPFRDLPCREDRKRRRATKKRVRKADKGRKESDAKVRAATAATPVAGRKSAEALETQRRSRPQKFGKSEFGKSAQVFARIQEQRDAAAAGERGPKGSRVGAGWGEGFCQGVGGEWQEWGGFRGEQHVGSGKWGGRGGEGGVVQLRAAGVWVLAGWKRLGLT